MTAEDPVASCVTRLHTLLNEEFQASGDDLTSACASLNAELPHDLIEELQELAGRAQLLERARPVSPAMLSAFAFRCGQAYERLDGIRLGRAIERLGFVPSDALPEEELNKTDLDALARFAAARDRALKTVADFTLKFLVVSAILLVAALTLGLV